MNEVFDKADLLTISTLVIGFTVWLVRLEGKVKYAEKSIDELHFKHENLDSELMKRLGSLETAIARVEGYLKGITEDSKND